MAATCDPTTLAAQATCINCGVPPGMYLPVIIVLLCTVVANQGTAGGNLTGTGNPNTNSVSATGAGQLYFDTTNPAAPNVWYATGAGTGNWVEIIGS